jgi:hypothetical protein
MTDESPLHKPIIGRVMLELMRTAMRVTNHIRPLKDRMSRSMRAYRGAGRESADFVLPARSGRQVTSYFDLKKSGAGESAVFVGDSPPSRSG